ncbi:MULTISPECIES: ADP-ribose diphosphatase [unclassified Shewanella]|nr:MULTISPECIES: ADP-ribose diphosphatase [unclassified Shewanella]MDO6619337.1 ADP-ribose diphosphatase [Shewanella sp. 6_MG-2023]MDO6641423.1 ADP-ribose diphosphatase [Shewanella sp. 5_MG-2023]PMG30668.1 ADP-ribose diphosphatase [Shewanella sp. 10N.286.52.C2]PMG41591.1 ADP-ribose diphosphatase [Shewanella sp. 10N.286.52.B9]
MKNNEILAQFNAETDVEIIDTKTVFKGFFQVDEYQFKHKLFDGGWSEVVSREVFERGNAVVVLPYDPVTHQVVLIEQIRLPAIGTTNSVWLLELVAGMIAADEVAEEVAHRELMEETGLSATEMHFVNSFLATPGGSSERFYFYWAKVDASKAQGIHGLEYEHEDIKVHVVDFDVAMDMVNNGRIDNASTVIGLQWLALNLDKVTS